MDKALPTISAMIQAIVALHRGEPVTDDVLMSISGVTNRAELEAKVPGQTDAWYHTAMQLRADCLANGVNRSGTIH